MTGDRVKEQYYRNWIYRETNGLWHFIDRQHKDHGPFETYEETCKGIDDYLRRSVDDHNKADTVGKES